MENSGLVSIILLNYNGKQFNKNCVDSILMGTYKNYEIIFVDNKSTDGSLEEIETLYFKEIEGGRIKIVKNNENLWFAGGNNSGVENVSKSSEYIWLLNNDTIIDKNCLLYLVKAIESDKSLGAVSSMILDKGSESLIQNNIEHSKTLRMNVFGVQIRESAKNINDVLYTNFLCGCSFLYRRSILDYPFFDFYKIYSEDTQLSWEILFKGYQLGICKKSIVHHFGSGTMKKMSYVKAYTGIRNSFINYSAFLSKGMRIKLFFPFMILQILHVIYNITEIRLFLKAEISSLLWIKRNKDKIDIVRHRINEGRTLSEKDFLSTMSSDLVDSSLYSGKVKKFFIDMLNYMIRLYFKTFSIPSRKIDR